MASPLPEPGEQLSQSAVSVILQGSIPAFSIRKGVLSPPVIAANFRNIFDNAKKEAVEVTKLAVSNLSLAIVRIKGLSVSCPTGRSPDQEEKLELEEGLAFNCTFSP